MERALRLAQERAALPVEQHGLGLHPLNTPAERAAAMGFDTDAYHSTKHDPSVLLPRPPASSSRGTDFGVHVGDADTAFNAIIPSHMRRYYTDVEGGEKGANEIANRINGSQIMPLRVNPGRVLEVPDFGRWDYPGNLLSNVVKETWSPPHNQFKDKVVTNDPDTLRELVDMANSAIEQRFEKPQYEDALERIVKGRGYDSIAYKNDIEGEGSMSRMFFDPDRIRSRFAVFDPWRKDAATAAALGLAAPDLLAAEPEGYAGGGLVGGLKDLVEKYIKLYHGTPHKFAPTERNKLGEIDLSKMGSGQGAQMYGEGFYAAQAPAVAVDYRKILAGMPEIQGFRIGDRMLTPSNHFDYSPRGNSNRESIQATLFEDALIDQDNLITAHTIGGQKGVRDYLLNLLDDRIGRYADEWPEGILDARKFREEIAKPGQIGLTSRQPGHLYTLELPEERNIQMLDWDLPMNQQSQSVQDALNTHVPYMEQYFDPDAGMIKRRLPFTERAAPWPMRDFTGQHAYEDLVTSKGSKKEASDFLRSIGVPGLKYFDEHSRQIQNRAKNLGEEFDPNSLTRNYVIFDPEAATIIDRKARGGLVGGLEELVKKYLKLYHGSPHVFPPTERNPLGEFDLSKMGTGEGAQAYGQGAYLAEDHMVARDYARKLAYKAMRDRFMSELPKDADFEDVMGMLGTGHFSEPQEALLNALAADDWLGFDYPSQAISAAYKDLHNYDPSDALRDAVQGTQKLYTVEVPEEHIGRMLDWDLPLSQQPADVRAGLSKYGYEIAPTDKELQQQAQALWDNDAADWANEYGADPDDFGNQRGVNWDKYMDMARSNAGGLDSSMTGKGLYDHLIREAGWNENLFEPDTEYAKGVSDELLKVGIPGIKYLDGNSRQAGEGTRNFVIFDPGITNIVERKAKGGLVGLAEKYLPRMMSIFSGGGTLEHGLEGLVKPVMAVEKDPDIARHYAKAHGENILNADVRDVDFKPMAGEVDYLHASPSCKNYSSANCKTEDPIDLMTAEATARAIRDIRPPLFTLENVPAYQKRGAFQQIADELSNQGYNWDIVQHNAADLGAPSSRNRMMVRASLGDLPPAQQYWPKPGDWFPAIEDQLESMRPSQLAPWQLRRLAERGIDPASLDTPLLVGGGSGFKGDIPLAFAGKPGITVLSSPVQTDRVVLPGGDVRALNPRSYARLLGLSDSYPLPDDRNLAKIIVGNGMAPAMTREVVEPLLNQRLINMVEKYK